MKHKGTFKLKQYRNSQLIAERVVKNTTTSIGAQTVLNSIFRNIPHPTSWFISLIESAGFTSFSISDTMAVHAGWTEFTDYVGNRKQYIADPASGRAIENETSPARFLFNGIAIIKAIFLVSNETKGGTAGVLLSTSVLGSDGDAGSLSLVVGDEIEVEYDVEY